MIGIILQNPIVLPIGITLCLTQCLELYFCFPNSNPSSHCLSSLFITIYFLLLSALVETVLVLVIVDVMLLLFFQCIIINNNNDNNNNVAVIIIY